VTVIYKTVPITIERKVWWYRRGVISAMNEDRQYTTMYIRKSTNTVLQYSTQKIKDWTTWTLIEHMSSTLTEHTSSTLTEHMRSPPVFSGVRFTRSLVLCIIFVDRCMSFCLFGHCMVCPSLIYGFRLPLWYLQALH
jgi:hypothetical protein